MTWQKSLEDLLARTIGLDSASLGPTLVTHALQRRMKALGVARESEYLGRIQTSTAELQELIEELVVSESWFFRDSQPFVLLQQHATAWLAEPTSVVFRCLSLACATGDEPYTIAMVLLESGVPRERFQIDAIDISNRALERAHRGVYGQKAMSKVEPELRARYFRPHPDGMEVDPEIRRTVRFTIGNLVRPESLRLRPPYDVIFCRNLLIYLTDSAREQAAETLNRLLAPTGLLFVGHAEILPLLDARFVPVKWRGSFAYQRRSSGSPAPAPRPVFTFTPLSSSSSPPPAPPAPPIFPASKSPLSPQSAWQPKPTTTTTTFPAPAAPSSNGPPDPPAPPAFSGSDWARTPAPDAGPGVGGGGGAGSNLDPILDQAEALANRHQYDTATQLCEQSIRIRGPSARAFHLLGMIRNALGDIVQAEQFLSRAVYLDGQHEEALLTLSAIARRRGDHTSAANFQRRAERARRRKP